MKRWLLYPERDFYGDGSIVAMCCKEYPICFIRSYSKYYRVEVFNIKKEIIYIPYDNIELRKLNRKLLKKQKRGYLNSEQHSKIILHLVCSMVKKRCTF